MDNNANGLARLDNTKIFDVIRQMDIPESDKQALTTQVLSDDISIRKGAMEMITQSQIAQHDLSVVLGELDALNKKGMYVRAEQTIKTGSGTMKIEMRGGDTKLIVPVVIVAGIVIIAALLIVFWK